MKSIFDSNTFYNGSKMAQATSLTHSLALLWNSLFKSFHFNMEKREERQMFLYIFTLPRFPCGIQRILLSIFFVSCQPLWHWWNAAQAMECKFLWNALCSLKKLVFFQHAIVKQQSKKKKVYSRDVNLHKYCASMLYFGRHKQTTLLFIHLYPFHANDSRHLENRNERK